LDSIILVTLGNDGNLDTIYNFLRVFDYDELRWLRLRFVAGKNIKFV